MQFHWKYTMCYALFMKVHKLLCTFTKSTCTFVQSTYVVSCKVHVVFVKVHICFLKSYRVWWNLQSFFSFAMQTFSVSACTFPPFSPLCQQSLSRKMPDVFFSSNSHSGIKIHFRASAWESHMCAMFLLMVVRGKHLKCASTYDSMFHCNLFFNRFYTCCVEVYGVAWECLRVHKNAWGCKTSAWGCTILNECE